jgi:hypothetical protein
MEIYPVSLLIFGLLAAGIAVWAWRLSPENLPRWERLPRAPWLGAMLAAAGLVWCIPHARPMLPTGLQSYLLPMAALCTWLSYMYLDYLFARAAGGLMILSAHFFLASAFAQHTPGRELFAIALLAMGTLGIFFCGKPYWLRDLIRRMAVSPRWRQGAVGILAGYALLGIAFGAWHLSHHG